MNPEPDAITDPSLLEDFGPVSIAGIQSAPRERRRGDLQIAQPREPRLDVAARPSFDVLAFTELRDHLSRGADQQQCRKDGNLLQIVRPPDGIECRRATDANRAQWSLASAQS